MEFSYNYQSIMTSWVDSMHSLPSTNTSWQNVNCGPSEFYVKINKFGGEVPTAIFSEVANIVESTSIPDDGIEIVVPLLVSENSRVCSGTDTIIKTFIRQYGRLNKVSTSKGETYYGGYGIILDSNFQPLLYATKDMKIQSESGTISITSDNLNIHVSPLVFIDDTKTLNKSLAKKAVKYFLTHPIGRYREAPITPKILIDNGEGIIRKPVKPQSSDINKDINVLLKDNIDEVLRQIIYDN